jgi:hypothetical protein
MQISIAQPGPCVSPTYPGTVQDYDKLPVQFNGFCPVALLSGGEFHAVLLFHRLSLHQVKNQFRYFHKKLTFLYFFENPIGFQRRMIDFGKKLLFTRCLKMYSFFAFTFKVCKVLLRPKYIFCQKVNMGIKNAEF